MDVKLPNGKTIKNVPAGTTKAQVMARAVKAGIIAKEDVPGKRGSVLDPMRQGLTFGFADELGGAGARLGRWLGGAPKSRIDRAGLQEMERQRANLAAYREREPVASFVTELGGSLVSGGPLLKGIGKAGQALNIGQKTSLVGGATAEGALAGAGAADQNKALGAGVGGLFGLGLGGAIPAAGYGLRKTGGAISDFAQPLVRRLREEPSSTAGRLVSEALGSEGVTPSILKARSRQMGPQATLTDIGGAKTQGLAQGVIDADRSGDAIATARRVFGERAAGTTSRLKADIAEATGDKKRMLTALDEINERQRAMSSKAYSLAYKVPVSPADSQLIEILNRPSVREAIPKAIRNAKDAGRRVPVLEKIVMQGDDWRPSQELFPDMQALDDMKKALDRMVDSAAKRGDESYHAIKTARNSLRKRLDEINPIYGQARSIYAGDAALKDAMVEGEKMLTRKTREVSEYLRGSGDSEREAYLTGAVEAIKEKMGRARSGEMGEFRFLEDGNARQKLRLLFPRGRGGDKQLGQLLRTLKRERQFATTQGQMVGNSQTALRQAGGRMVETGAEMPTSTEMLTSPIRGGISAGLHGVSRALSKVSDKSIHELGQLLFSPGNIDTVLAELTRRGIPQQQAAEFINRFSRGSAALAPYGGMLGGQLVGEQ